MPMVCDRMKIQCESTRNKRRRKKIKRRPRIYSCVCVCVLSPTPPLQNKNERPCVDSLQFPTLAKQKQMQNDEIPSSSSATFAHFGNRQRGGLSVLYARLSILVFFIYLYTHTRRHKHAHTRDYVLFLNRKRWGGSFIGCYRRTRRKPQKPYWLGKTLPAMDENMWGFCFTRINNTHLVPNQTGHRAGDVPPNLARQPKHTKTNDVVEKRFKKLYIYIYIK